MGLVPCGGTDCREEIWNIYIYFFFIIFRQFLLIFLTFDFWPVLHTLQPPMGNPSFPVTPISITMSFEPIQPMADIAKRNYQSFRVPSLKMAISHFWSLLAQKRGVVCTI